MQFFRGLQSYFTEFDGVYRLPDERIRIWNIPADSSTLTEKGLKVSKRSTRCIRSTCARLDEENSDRYIIFNFSPVMMELVESCHRGQVLDFSKQALQNFALLMEVCLTVSKWIQAGGETSGSEHVAILTFFEETDAVWYPNYAAMLAACYLIFSGYSSGGGSETLEYVEQELGILRSKLHAPSQESYANYFQLLIEIPILPNPNRLRLVRVSLQNMQSLQGKKLGLQIENEGRTFLFSDPTEWYVGDSASFEVCINTNTSLFGDFSISVYDYEVTSGGSAASASKSEAEVKTLSSSMSTVSQKKLVTKRRLFRLAFSTIFIHQEVYRVRVREMDYVAPNTLSDDFFAHLHFSKCQPGPMDGEYVEQLSQRVEQSPQRQQFRVLHPRGRGVPGFRGGAGSVASRRSQSRYRNGFDGELDGNGSSAMYYRHDGTMCYGSSSDQSVIRWAHLVPPSGGPSLYMPVSMHLIQEDPRQMDQEDDEVEGEPEVIARQPVSVERPKTPQQLRGGGQLMQGQAMGTPVRESSKAHELADRSPMPMRPTPPTVRLATPPPPTGGKLPPPPPLVPGGAPPCPAPPPPPTLSKGAPPAPPPPLSSSMKGAPPAPPPPPPGKFGTSKAVNGSVPPPPVPAARVGPKLKSMFWKSISKPVGIWAVHDDDARRVALDEAFLATMFAAKKNVVAASRETTSKSKSNRLVQHSHVFTGQRLQNIAIALRQLRIPVEDVCRALLYCDTSLLNAEQRETLISVLPLPEDITALAHEKATGCVEWTDVETYLYSLATTIVDVVERVQLWDAAESLEETVAQVTEQLQAEEAAVAVMTSKQTRFARLMRTVLAVGNFMNQGTTHANASGFRLESLQQLNFVKAVDGKVTMLEVIVTLLLEEAPELVQLGEEIAAVRAVASSPLQDLGQQVTQVNYLLQSMRRVVEESKDTSEWFAQRLPHYTPETTTDALPHLMEKAVSRYLPVVMQMVLRHQQLRNEVAAMLESYGEDPSSDETLLWQHVIVFEKDLQQCVTKVQQCKLTKYSLLISVDPDATQLGEADTKECEQSSHVDPAALELPKVPAGGVCGIRHPKLRLSDADDDSD